MIHAHFGEEQINLTDSVVCKVCSSLDTKLAWAAKSNVDGILANHYDVYRCQECGAGITYPVPAPETLSKYYQTGVYQSSGGLAFPLIDAFLMAMYEQRLREIKRWLRPPGKLLDVGCGKGRFVACAKNNGWNAKGVEPTSNQVAAARTRYGVNVFEGELQQASFADKSFDIVTAWHVLEHISEPHALISEVRRILRPGGLFICEVPNFASWQARLGREHWFHLDMPRHLIHYSSLALQQLLSQHNLNVVKQHTFSLESGPLGMLESMLNRLGLPPNWLYRWVKRSVPTSHRLLALNVIAGMLMSAPALIAEIVASLSAPAGGVLRVVAVAK